MHNGRKLTQMQEFREYLMANCLQARNQVSDNMRSIEDKASMVGWGHTVSEEAAGSIETRCSLCRDMENIYGYGT